MTLVKLLKHAFIVATSAAACSLPARAYYEAVSPLPTYPQTEFTATYERKYNFSYYPHCKISSDGKGAITVFPTTIAPFVEEYASHQPTPYKIRRPYIGPYIYESLYLGNSAARPRDLGRSEISNHQCQGWRTETEDGEYHIRTVDTRWYDIHSGCLVKYSLHDEFPLWAKMLMQKGNDLEIRLANYDLKPMSAEEIAAAKDYTAIRIKARAEAQGKTNGLPPYWSWTDQHPPGD